METGREARGAQGREKEDSGSLWEEDYVRIVPSFPMPDLTELRIHLNFILNGIREFQVRTGFCWNGFARNKKGTRWLGHRDKIRRSWKRSGAPQGKGGAEARRFSSMGRLQGPGQE